MEMCRDGICKVNSRLYTKSIAFEDINYQLAQNEDKTAIFENRSEEHTSELQSLREISYAVFCLRSST